MKIQESDFNLLPTVVQIINQQPHFKINDIEYWLYKANTNEYNNNGETIIIHHYFIIFKSNFDPQYSIRYTTDKAIFNALTKRTGLEYNENKDGYSVDEFITLVNEVSNILSEDNCIIDKNNYNLPRFHNRLCGDYGTVMPRPIVNGVYDILELLTNHDANSIIWN